MTLNLEASDRCENTRDEYLADFKSHILPYFKDSKLDEIRPKDLRLWQANLLHTRSGVRVINIRNVFNNIMKDAFIDEIIHDNPFKRVKRPKKKKSKIFPFKLEEVKKLIDKAEGWFQNYLIISFFTGIRPGELIALEWENIDFENHKIHIRKSMRKGKLTDTKTYASLRDVDILPIVEKALKSQQKITGDKKNLFVTQYGKGYKRSEKISSKWKPLLEKCDIQYRILYKTRHTFASVMIQQGEEIAWVSKMLGHADISVTLTKYTDYLPREDIERASFLSNFKV
jgi:integrase